MQPFSFPAAFSDSFNPLLNYIVGALLRLEQYLETRRMYLTEDPRYRGKSHLQMVPYRVPGRNLNQAPKGYRRSRW